MIELLKALQIIEAIKRITGPWEVYHLAGGGEMDEETADHLEAGKVAIISGGTLRATYKEGGKQHELRGSVSFGGFRYREIIKWDGKDVEGDDLYTSSHLTDSEDRRVIVDFKFTSGGTRHHFRFKKSIQGV